jgi:hypothetical protein
VYALAWMPTNINLNLQGLAHLKDESQFPDATSLSGYSEVLTSLIRVKALHGATKSSGFQRFLDFAKVAISTGTPEERLLAVALICKVANSVKSVRDRILDILDSETLTAPLPPLKLLSDSDDRFYAANVWRFIEKSWVIEYLALGVLVEESAEKSRRECAEGLLAQTSGLGEAFSILEMHLNTLQFTTESMSQSAGQRPKRSVPGDSMARRIRRVFIATRESLAANRKTAREDVGPNLRSLLRKCFDRVGFPKDYAAKMELAKETFELILQTVRSRYALALLAETYSPIITVRDWFSDSEWRDLVEEEVAKELAESIQAAIELLARSGSVDNALFELLVLASGSNQHARVMTGQIIERNTGLSPETIAWLSGLPIRRSTALSTESALVRVDDAIGEIMLAAISAANSANAVQEDVVPQLAIFQSLPRHILDDFLSHFSKVRSLIQALCEMRRLEAFGTINEVEEFSPLRHQFEISSDFGARTIRILQPGAAVRAQDGAIQVVRKAVVEPE